MSANLRAYDDYVKYMPEKEARAIEQIASRKRDPDSLAMSIVKQVNRNRKMDDLDEVRKPGPAQTVKRA